MITRQHNLGSRRLQYRFPVLRTLSLEREYDEQLGIRMLPLHIKKKNLGSRRLRYHFLILCNLHIIGETGIP